MLKKPDLARPTRRLAMLAALVLSVVLSVAACGDREAAPQFRYTLLDGKQASIQALRGRVVLVNFWATNCVSCLNEMPALVSTHLKFQPRGFETLAVAMRHDPPANVASFAERHQLPFGVVIDNTGAIAQGFGDVRVTPTTYLIDRRGAIVKRYVGEPDFKELHRLIEKLLGESA